MNRRWKVASGLASTGLLLLLLPPAATADSAPKLQQGPTHTAFRWCVERNCDPTNNAEYSVDIQLDAPDSSGARAQRVTRTDLVSGVSVTSHSVVKGDDAKRLANKPVKKGVSPEQAFGAKKMRPADAYGPDCCSPYGGGVLDVTNTGCDAFHSACVNFRTQVWWNWGDGRVWNQRPGLDYWAQPDTYQWLDFSWGADCCFQDGGVVWGLPQGYYDYQGRGYGSGFLSDKGQTVHNCVIQWGCWADYHFWTNMYVHNDGSWYTSWGID